MASVKTVKVDLPAEIFDVQVNIPLIHQVVVAQQAAARQGTHDTKSRGEVRGGGRKPYKQKGTGRARQGSTRAPQFAGGGTVHGPTPRSYDQRTPKKMKAAALRGALSDRARAGRVHVVESFVSGDKPSTKNALAALSSLSDRPRALVVLERGDDLTWLSLRNVDTVHILAVDQLNTYDVLLSDDVVFTKGAYDAFVAGPSTGKSVKAVATSTEAADIEDDKVGVVAEAPFEGAAAALEDGSAPAGYEIKGKSDSKKYHAPGGRWYDNTTADVWFKTAADAEAAGFVEAGAKASTEEADQ
ncbi:50S ribosomal protein L4 [Nocardioides iriomotensis]|uniref:Large ribosomal subunit protein uL4 n=1 Tax=Nocardioides iriomotensis TaxID=715784 RepID=A0A4Q5JCT3_9ACTN|nr:50S ribosomal protein L4 [Nocardioides iriomotensis]RYU15755.1 50S ribosomal protein L4 [Nocardioides iriomotensis]